MFVRNKSRQVIQDLPRTVSLCQYMIKQFAQKCQVVFLSFEVFFNPINLSSDKALFYNILISYLPPRTVSDTVQSHNLLSSTGPRASAVQTSLLELADMLLVPDKLSRHSAPLACPRKTIQLA